MKKVFALVLAVMMMATVAFAANAETGGPGVSDKTADVGGNANGGSGDPMNKNPGGKITIAPGAFDGDLAGKIAKGDFTSENFTVTTKRFDKGANLVKSVEFDDDDCLLVIKLNDDYDLKATTSVNLAIKEIKITAKRSVGDVKKNSKYTLNKETTSDNLEFNVGYQIVPIDIEDDFDLTVYKDSGVLVEKGSRAVVEASDKGNLVKFVKADGGPSYGTVNLDFEDVAYASGRVYKDDVVFLKFNEDVNVDLVKKYPDADLSFVNFKGAPTFNSNMELEIYADEDQYIYEVKDGKIASCNLKWDDDAYAFTGKVRTLGAYVISDTKLAVDSTPGDGNPDTGANDVVGIATALAAVALVSAAAVSLKK